MNFPICFVHGKWLRVSQRILFYHLRSLEQEPIHDICEYIIVRLQVFSRTSFSDTRITAFA